MRRFSFIFVVHMICFIVQWFSQWFINIFFFVVDGSGGEEKAEVMLSVSKTELASVSSKLSEQMSQLLVNINVGFLSKADFHRISPSQLLNKL